MAYLAVIHEKEAPSDRNGKIEPNWQTCRNQYNRRNNEVKKSVREKHFRVVNYKNY